MLTVLDSWVKRSEDLLISKGWTYIGMHCTYVLALFVCMFYDFKSWTFFCDNALVLFVSSLLYFNDNCFIVGCVFSWLDASALKVYLILVHWSVQNINQFSTFYCFTYVRNWFLYSVQDKESIYMFVGCDSLLKRHL